LTREQLFKEDKHQLKLTLEQFLNSMSDPSETCTLMLSYFDDDSLSVIDIHNQIISSHFDLAISMFKKYMNIVFLESEMTAIQTLVKNFY
jgi:hypothetical protein